MQRAMEKGDRRREMERDSGDNQSGIKFLNDYNENENVLPRYLVEKTIKIQGINNQNILNIFQLT